MIALLRRTGGDAQDAAQRPLVELEPHANIDERGADLELLYDQPLSVTRIEGQEREGDAVEKVNVVDAERDIVRHDVPVHPAVDALQVFDLLGRFLQFLQARSARRAKRVMGQELVAVSNSRISRTGVLATKIQDVAAGP